MFTSLIPSFCSTLLRCPSFVPPQPPPWASELDCLPFGFSLFLPSSVSPLIAPLFLTSQGCQLSGHSWKIHSQHGNCKQTDQERKRLREKKRWWHWSIEMVSDRKQNGSYCFSPHFIIDIIFMTSTFSAFSVICPHSHNSQYFNPWSICVLFHC